MQSFEQLEKELLNGQKLQGTLTCKEVIKILEREGSAGHYPLFKSIHAIAFEVSSGAAGAGGGGGCRSAGGCAVAYLVGT